MSRNLVEHCAENRGDAAPVHPERSSGAFSADRGVEGPAETVRDERMGRGVSYRVHW